MKHSDRTTFVSDARKRVESDPGRFRAAVIEGELPLRDHEDNNATLFRLIKTADEFFRERVDCYKDAGHKAVFGNLGAGIIVFETPEGRVGVGIDKRSA